MAGEMIDKQLFDCVKLLEVQESSPVAGGETPFNSIDVTPQSSASTSVTHCCYRETRNYTVLVLICDNGYLLIRLELFLQPPIVKQLKWYEGREQHILDITFDPLGEWLACACLDGCLYLVPVLTLMLPDCFPTHTYGSLSDLTIVTPTKKVAPPTSIVWWESIDGGQICIVGSELGEITLFNLHECKEMGYLSMRGCVDQLLLARKSDRTTHLLINLRGGEWWWLLLEERYHEDVGTSYSDAQESGFEVVLDDTVLRSCLTKPDSPQFEPKLFKDFNELTKLSTQEFGTHEMLGALNLKAHCFEVFPYSFDLFNSPLRTFKLPPNCTSILSTDRLLYTISHNDESDELSFTLSVISSELAQRNSFQLPDNALLQQFQLHSEASIIGFFLTSLESSDLAKESREMTTPTNLNGCIIVTSNAVYQCKQIRSPESLFLEMALSTSNLHMTDEIAITYKLDICHLYQVAAEQLIKRQEYKRAIKLFEQSKCPPIQVIKSFVQMDRIPELLAFLLNMLYNEDEQASVSQSNLLQNVLIQCLIHQSLAADEPAQESALKEHLSQFINDKFLYDHSVAMETMIRSGMKSQMFELAQSGNRGVKMEEIQVLSCIRGYHVYKDMWTAAVGETLTHGKIPQSIDMLIKHGTTELGLSLQSAIANGQFAEALSSHSQGLLLHLLSPCNFVKCVLAKPSLLEQHLSYLLSIHQDLDLTLLMRLVWLLDPSHHAIHPLLQRARSSLKRSNSTGSLFSVASVDSSIPGHSGTETSHEDKGPSLEAYIEAFLITLITLNHKRNLLPIPVLGLLSLSPLANKIGISPQDKALRPITSFTDGSKALQGSMVSCGLNHGALVVGGDLYTWGSTRNGKLGHGDIEQQPIAAPLKVETLSMLKVRVLTVSCGAEHTVALCQEGVYSWGSATHGQLGLGDTLKRTRPVPISQFSNIATVTVVCGQYHCLALDEEHRVWSWGWGVHGQTGVGVTDDLLVPTLSKFLSKLSVSYISAGFNHSAVISKEGKLYTFGNGMYGQLGHGDQEKKATPTLVQALADKFVYLVACGNSHTLAVCNEQQVYHWGKNFHKPHPGNSPQSLRQYTRTRREGATSPAVLNVLQPVPIHDLDIDDVIVQIECGNYHSVILSASGKVYSWGNNIHGQIGHTHTPELSQPKLISKLDLHVIKTISCGDEFSVAVDSNGISWVWGRDELGQLGMEFPQGIREGRKVCIFAPNPNPQIPKVVPFDAHSQKSADQEDNTLLAIDMDWDLPDFSNIGSSNISYCRESLDAAFKSLHGFYRTGNIMNYCIHLKDYKSLAAIMMVEKQWPQVLYWRLQSLSANPVAMDTTVILTLVRETLESHLSESIEYRSRDFIIRTAQMLSELFEFWTRQSLDLTELENLLTEHISALAYPLSMVLESNKIKFSFKFCLLLTMETAKQITAGTPPLRELMEQNRSCQPAPGEGTGTADSLEPTATQPLYKTKPPIETSPNDSRLWNEVLRNLSKDLTKHTGIVISENSLSAIRNYRQRNTDEERDAPVPRDSIIAFSCGHAFSEMQFHDKILVEFLERVQDFLTPEMPHVTLFLQQYFKQCSLFTSGCPYCVFQYLRKAQLEKEPGIPIRPWSY